MTLKDFNIQRTFNKLKEQLKMPKEYTLKPDFRWSHLKAAKININEMVATQTGSNSSG